MGSFLRWFVKLKAFYVLGLLCTGAWFGSKWFVSNPTWDWEPAAASALLIAAIFGAEYAEFHERAKLQREKDTRQDLSIFNADIRRLMSHISLLPNKGVQPQDVQDLVQVIASTFARILFDRDELPIPPNSRRVYPDNQRLNCDVCQSKNVTIHPTGHCTRCKFDSRSWMQP